MNYNLRGDIMLKIKNVITEKLFGYYSYNFLKDNPEKDISDFLILYGDNGTGKTTILKSIFHLLSTSRNSGHKSQLARTKFKSITVILNDGTSIKAEREDILIGTYSIIIKNESDEVIHYLPMIAEETNRIRVGFKSEELEQKYDALLQYLESKNILIYYLTENRILNGKKNEYFSIDKYSEEEYIKYMRKNNNLRRETAAALEDIELIDKTVANLTTWIQNQNLLSSQKGENDANVIYRDIVTRLSSSSISEGEDIEDQGRIQKSIMELDDINTTAQNYSKYGLLSKFDFSDFIKIYKSSPQEKQVIINNVLEPYIDSVKAKISALKFLFEVIDEFISNLNDGFLLNKKIVFNINNGFSVEMLNTKEKIPFSLLSSGEKHIILLLSNILLSISDASQIIIDEPEISLNIKWQRKFLDTINILNRKNKAQFLISTHSVEILSSHWDSVIQLMAQEDADLAQD